MFDRTFDRRHEIAHALARHSTEKMGMGLGISVALSVLQMALGVKGGPDEGAGPARESPEQRQQRLEMERMRRVYQRQVGEGEGLGNGGQW